jgi:hypothetical protein
LLVHEVVCIGLAIAPVIITVLSHRPSFMSGISFMPGWSAPRAQPAAMTPTRSPSRIVIFIVVVHELLKRGFDDLSMHQRQRCEQRQPKVAGWTI